MAPQKKKRKHNAERTRRAYIIGRYSLVLIALVALAATIVLFLVNTTIIHNDDWTRKGNSSLGVQRTINPLRGDILACDGSILATNLNHYNVRIDFRSPRFRTDWYAAAIDSLADTLAVYYPRRTRQEWHQLLERPLNDSVQNRSRGYMLLKDVSYEDYLRVCTFPFFKRSKNRSKTGICPDPVLTRDYPYGHMAELSIGRVGEVDGHRIEGISGLEQALDTILYGQAGIKEKMLFTRGEAYWTVKEPVNGCTVKTTIDITIQDIVEQELGKMLVNCKGDWGSAIVMDVKTGDIKAISNLDRDTVGNAGYIEARNHIVERYEPGSVIKVLAMLVALEDGFAFPLERSYYIEPKGVGYRYARVGAIKDTHSPSNLAVNRFIEYSSNIGMTKLMAPHFESDVNSYRERVRRLGFFDRFNTGMAREKPPVFTNLDPKRGGHAGMARQFYGYCSMVPPLYTCALYNAIANDGKFVRPRLVSQLFFPDGRDSVLPVSYVRDSICSKKNAQILRDMIHSVVYGEGGTAKNLRNTLVDIAGKTGTAEIAFERPKDVKQEDFKGGYQKGKHNRVAFCGFFPFDNPRFTCMVIISHPKGPFGANTTCGEVLKNIAFQLYSRGYLGDNPDYKTDENKAPARPTIYASHNKARSATLHRYIGFDKAVVLTAPASDKVTRGIVPDVRGLGIREALVKIETAGFNAHFIGSGYVISQSPEPGTKAQPGSRVTISLKQD